jgi:hypothetical protein
MKAHQLPQPKITPNQLSLRIRHPSIDPETISATLRLEPEHCFKAGEARTLRADNGRSGFHTQSYWLAPVTPNLWTSSDEPVNSDTLAVKLAAGTFRPARDLRVWGVDSLLVFFLHRLSAHQSFLQQIQTEGGDISLLLSLDRESTPEFTVPLAVSRLLVQLGIVLEFSFDT